MCDALPRGCLSRALSISLMMMTPGLARAQAPAAAPPTAPVMTLDQALTYARDRQPRIKSALAEYEARRAEARVPRAQWLPQVGATAQIFAGTANNSTASYLNVPELDIPRIGGSKSQTESTASWTPAGSTLAGIGLGQEVYDFGRISAQITVADAYAAMAKANAETVALDVALGVEEAFHGVLAAKDVLQATEEAYKRATTHRDYAQAGTKSGMRPPIDLTRAQADVAVLQVRLVQAQAGVEAARAALAAAIGSDQLEVDAAPLAVDASPAPALAQALDQAAKRNPAIVAAVQKLGAQHAAVSALTRQLLPNIFATATLTGRAGGVPPSSGGVGTPYGAGWLPDVPNWDVGLVLQWNLFDGTILAKRAAAKAREDAARADLELVRTLIGLDAERGFLDLDAALKALPNLQLAVDAAVANQKQAEARFRAGLGTIIELADAEALLTNAQLNLAVGQFNVARARAALGRVMGRPLSSAQR